MKFTKFVWENYLETEKGKSATNFFVKFYQHHKNKDKELLEFTRHWFSQGRMNYDRDTVQDIESVLDCISEIRDCENEQLVSKKIENREQSEKYYEDLAFVTQEDENGEDEDIFELDSISDLSVALFCLYPKYFFPYYFYPNFNALKSICSEFGIFLPPVPPKNDSHRRYFYYLELCKVLYDFWENLDLNPEHLPVFLYKFAPEVLVLQPKLNEILPKPNRAWFIGGGVNNNGDFNYLDKINSNSQAYWQGNKDTEVGDIVVMYCLAPRSYIHSIWRAILPGGIEPFFYFYSTVWIGNPQIVVPIKLKEIKVDKILSEFPLVKGNMQGINGRQIPKKYYDRILELLTENGMDAKNLPQLENNELNTINLKNERDVEAYLLEPLLKDLNFDSDNWERQVSVRSGRNERIIPDYLINISRNSEQKTIKADFVWEAKFSIENKDGLIKDFGQVRSYAKLVDAKGIGLISKEGVWICMKTDDFYLKNTKHWSATKIQESDSLAEIRSLAGKKSFKN